MKVISLENRSVSFATAVKEPLHGLDPKLDVRISCLHNAFGILRSGFSPSLRGFILLLLESYAGRKHG
jgi:hypothetical protein